MRRSVRSSVETRVNRVRRRSRRILVEIGKTVLLMTCVAVIASMLIFAYNFVIVSPYFQMKETLVRGTERLQSDAVVELTGLKPSQNILMTNLGAVARKVKANPWVKDVSVRRDFPDRLVIEVTERKPVALVERGDGLYFIERDGTAFEKIATGEKTDLPVLTGFYRKGAENREMILKSLELLDFMASYTEVPEIRHISEIHGDDLFGLSLFAEGLCLKLGFGEFDTKLRRLKPVLADLARRSLSGYFIIDLNNPGKVTVQHREFRVPVKVTGGVRA